MEVLAELVRDTDSFKQRRRDAAGKLESTHKRCAVVVQRARFEIYARCSVVAGNSRRVERMRWFGMLHPHAAGNRNPVRFQGLLQRKCRYLARIGYGEVELDG